MCWLMADMPESHRFTPDLPPSKGLEALDVFCRWLGRVTRNWVHVAACVREMGVGFGPPPPEPTPWYRLLVSAFRCPVVICPSIRREQLL